MKRFVCKVCGYAYDPEVGDSEHGIAPGTAFENLPDDWVCPICGAGKEEFEEEEDYRKFIIRNSICGIPFAGCRIFHAPPTLKHFFRKKLKISRLSNFTECFISCCCSDT